MLLLVGSRRWRRVAAAAGAPTTDAATVQGRLALFPVATTVVAAIDVGQLRASPAAAKLRRWRIESQADQHELEEFARRTGFDPLKQLASVTVAFPEEARAHGEVGLVLRADHLDETRLVAYARDELQKTGDDLVASRTAVSRSGRRSAIPTLVGFFIDEQTFALGAGGLGREHGRPRRQDAPRRQRRDQPRAGAPGRARRRHARDLGGGDRPRDDPPLAGRRSPGCADAATIMTLSAAIDLGKGAGGDADRRSGHGRRPPAVAGDQGRPSRCATPSATRRC